MGRGGVRGGVGLLSLEVQMLHRRSYNGLSVFVAGEYLLCLEFEVKCARVGTDRQPSPFSFRSPKPAVVCIDTSIEIGMPLGIQGSSAVLHHAHIRP